LRRFVTACFALAALVNLAPTPGALSAARMEAAYGVTIAGSDLEILMRHRALLFGVVGGLLLAACFRTGLRPLAAAVGLFSMLSFGIVVLAVGDANPALQRLAGSDLVASAVLVAGVLLDRRLQRD